MNDEHIEPLERELATLLDAERRAPVEQAALDRVWTRVALPLAVGRGAGGPTRSWLASHAVGVAAASFVVGGLAGAATYATVQKPPPERIVYVERPAPPAPVSATTPVIASATPTAPPPAEPGSAAHPGGRPAQSAPASSLTVERALLDQARAALTSGDGARALSLADEHRRRFSNAQLSEEREAIAIQALVTLGRYDEARARAGRFRDVAPNSLFLPAIEASLTSIP